MYAAGAEALLPLSFRGAWQEMLYMNEEWAPIQNLALTEMG